MAMLKDLIKTTAKQKPIIMPVCLDDILFVHQILCRVFDRYVNTEEYNELIQDRLYFCFKPLHFDIGDIMDYPDDLRKYSLNFKLPQQILIESSEIIKCNKCHAIVTSELVPQSLVDEAYEFPTWQCPKCKIDYMDTELRCARCKECRDKSTLNSSLILKRFQPKHREPILALLEEILITAIPLITLEGDDFDKVLEVYAYIIY